MSFPVQSKIFALQEAAGFCGVGVTQPKEVPQIRGRPVGQVGIVVLTFDTKDVPQDRWEEYVGMDGNIRGLFFAAVC